MRIEGRDPLPLRVWTLLASLAAFISASGCAAVREGPAAGQEVVFFPAPASLSAAGEWSLTIQGRIFEPAGQSAGRQAVITLAARTLAPLLGVSPADAEQSDRFRERAGLLLSDSAGNTRVSVQLGEAPIALPASDPAGYFTADLTLSAAQVAALTRAGSISFASLPNGANGKVFAGQVMPLAEEGVIVVSDVDDTIKVTNIRQQREKLENTLLKPFAAVPGMAELYRSWQAAFGPGMHFHIVSAGPWQLYEPLRRFTEDAAFPPFTWSMRSLDIGSPAAVLAALATDARDYKRQAIRALMIRFPKRHVVLVGDSGEQDPEVYADIVDEFMDRVDAVFIRNVSGEGCAAERYRKLFADEGASKLSVFVDPGELPPLAPASPGRALCAGRH